MNRNLQFLLALTLCCTISCSDLNEDLVLTSLRGVFKCQESSVHSDFRSYLVEFDKVKDQENLFIILNFHNSGENEFIYAHYENDSLRIENQLINNMFISGKGAVSANLRSIDLFYFTDDGKMQLNYYAKIFR